MSPEEVTWWDWLHEEWEVLKELRGSDPGKGAQRVQSQRSGTGGRAVCLFPSDTLNVALILTDEALL